jgi:ribonuclease PH
MEAQLGLLSNAHGSAKYKQGESSVLAAVYGPAEVKTREEQGDRATVNVVFKRRDGKPGRQEKEYEKLLRNTLESIIMTKLHPRTSITIIAQVLVDDGSVRQLYSSNNLDSISGDERMHVGFDGRRYFTIFYFGICFMCCNRL